MINTYDIYLISDSTGETLERIFLAIKLNSKTLNIKLIFILLHEQKIKSRKSLKSQKKITTL